MIKGVEKKDGIKFDYLSPFNEPDGHWNWIGPKQEGTPATKKEIARAVRLISKEFVKEGIDTEITICEASDYRCMFSTHMTNHERGYEIQSFFCPDSVDTYLGNTPNVPHLIAGHSYWTNTPLESLRDYRRQLRDTLDKYKVDFWQTETCIMGNDEEIGGGGGFDHTMKTALYVATVARTYRKAIDDYMESPEKYKANMSWYQEQISNCTYRQFTTGFFYGKPDENTQIYDNNTYVKEYTYLGYAEEVDEKGYAHITQRNKFSVGETVEIMKPDGRNLTVTVKSIYDEEGNSVESAPHPQQKLAVDLGADIEKYDLLRRSEA